MGSPPIAAWGRPVNIGQYIPGGAITLNLGISSNSVQLSPFTGYRLWSSVNSFFDTGGSGVAASLSSHPLTAGMDILHLTDSRNIWLAAIVSTGSGVLYISQINLLP